MYSRTFVCETALGISRSYISIELVCRSLLNKIKMFLILLFAFFSNRIRETTRSILRDETTSIFREVLAAQKNDINTILRQSLTLPKPVMSRTTTPLPTAPVNISSPNVINTISISDVKQQHVLKLIRLNQINQAFEFVLSASDLNLVLYLCENVRSTELFSIQPCPLQTPVILSLIQQLAADLNTHQELKYRYLKKYFYSFVFDYFFF